MSLATRASQSAMGPDGHMGPKQPLPIQHGFYHSNVKASPSPMFWDASHIWLTNYSPQDLQINSKASQFLTPREKDQLRRNLMSQSIQRSHYEPSAALNDPRY